MTSTHVSEREFSPYWSTVEILTRRALVRLVRMPSLLIPMLVMPASFAVSFTGTFEGVTRVEAFPTDEFINWVAAFAMVQGSIFAGIGAAGAMAQDLDNGFIDRLLVSPIRRSAIIVGPLVHTATRALVPVTVVLMIGTASGLDFPGGVAAVLIAYGAGIGASLVLGALGLAVVLHIGNIRAMAIVQVLAFGLMFPSIGQVPLSLMTGWLYDVARVNPATNVIRMARQGFIGDVSWADTWPGLLVIAIGIFWFGGWARWELEQRAP
ncbi:MAG: ABC transporter permease [Actinobacteria bacterium]|nr:ABC transporter permease [Actinomycetota bacterium]